MTAPHTHGGTDAPECITCESQKPPIQGFNYLLQHVFEQGIRLGAGYRTYGAIPEWERKARFQAVMDAWHGNIWTIQDWHQARLDVGSIDGQDPLEFRCKLGRILAEHNQPCAPGCEYPPTSLGAQMGHPGGHYG